MKVTSIGGVDSFSLFKYNNKLYYMFGDVHNTINNRCDVSQNCDYLNYTFDQVKTYHSSCTSILPLLILWFTYNNDHAIKTDFYIESSFTNLSTYDIHLFEEIIKKRREEKVESLTTIPPIKNMSWLQLAYFVFASCLTKDKTKCPYSPFVHIHYTDIRLINQVFNSPFDISYLLEFTNKNNFHVDNDFSIDIIVIIKNLLNNYAFILDGLIDDQYDEMIDFLYSIPIKNELVKKAYHHMIRRYDESTVIRNGKRIHRVAAELQRLKLENHLVYQKLKLFIDDFNLNNKDLAQNNLKTYILANQFYFGKLDSFLFDIYTLSRMFIQQESGTVITYTGLWHHTTFSRFFKHYLNTLPIYENFTIDIDHLNQKKVECVTFNNLSNYIDVDQFRYYYKYKQID